MDHRQQLIDFVRARGGDFDTLVAVDLDLFFEGNDDVGSIAPNLIDHPGPQTIRRVLADIENRPDVSAVAPVVWLEESSEDRYYDRSDAWPYAHHVLVSTSLSPSDLDQLTASIRTDAASIAYETDVVDAPAAPAGSRLVYVWWD